MSLLCLRMLHSAHSTTPCDALQLLCRLHSYVDFVVCLGGDGTILHASSLFQRAIPPVIAFSLGSLGFLTNHTLATAEDDLRGVIYGCEDLEQCALDEEVRCSCS